MRSACKLLFAASIFILTSCYGNTEHSDENDNDLKTDSTLIPVDSTERDHTESIKGDTIGGKTGRVNGL